MITIKDVEHVAKLARLELTEEERAQLIAEAITVYGILQKTIPLSQDDQIKKIAQMDPFSKYDWFEAALRKELATK